MKILHTRMKIAAWDEAPVQEFDDGSKITRAVITFEGDQDGLTSGTSESVLYYRPDGTSSFTGVMRLTATLEGRSGSFVLTGAGTYDRTTSSETNVVVDGSGTDGLAGIRGGLRSEATHADAPYMPLVLEYELPT